MTIGEINMNNTLKKLTVLTLLFVFTGLFSTVVSATEVKQPTQTENTDDSITLPKDEYNNLLKRIEELEQLKVDEINQNLFDYYEKSKADTETGISTMFSFVAIVVGVAGVLVAIAGILVVINFTEGRKASKKAVETNKEAEETNKKAVEKLLLLDETKNQLDLYAKQLDLYTKRAKAQTSTDLALSIDIYTEVINEMEQFGLEDEYIFYERGNAYLSKFKQDKGIVDDRKGNVDIEIKNFERVYDKLFFTSYYIWFYTDLLTKAIDDFKNFSEKTSTDSLYITTNLKIIECLMYRKDYEKVFIALNDVNDDKANKDELISKIVALIIVQPNLYETFEKYADENTFKDISYYIYSYRELILNRIFANDIIFDVLVVDRCNRGEEDLIESRQTAYFELMKKLDVAHNLCNKLNELYLYTSLEYGKSLDTLLEDLLDDFTTCNKIRDGKLKIKQAMFFVFNEYCATYLCALNSTEYNSILHKINEITQDLRNTKTT